MIDSITLTLNILPKKVDPKRVGKDVRNIPRPRDGIVMQINFKVIKRSNIRVKQITISQELTVRYHSTSLEPYQKYLIENFKNPQIQKF